MVLLVRGLLRVGPLTERMAIDSWVFSEPWQLHALQTIHSSYDCIGDHATRAPCLYAARIIKEVFMCTSQ